MNVEPGPLEQMFPTALQAELALLMQMTQQMPTPDELAIIHQRLQSQSQMIDDMQLAIARAVFTLSTVDDGLEGLLELLQCAEDKPMLARQLSCLLTPLHQQLQYASSETSHLLFQLLDDARAFPSTRPKPSS